VTIETVLAATDFSAPAGRALGRAAALAAAHRARLVVIHVVPAGWLATLRAWTRAGAVEETAAAALEARLSGDAAALATAHGVAATSRVLEGDPRAVLPEAAAAFGADLLVVGAHGIHFVRDLLLGSTAIAALAAAPCPVLAVRLDPVRLYREALVGCDLSAASATAARTVAELVPDAALTLLHAYEDPYGAALVLASAPPDEVDRYRAAARAEVEAAIDRFCVDLGPLGERCGRILRHGPPALRFVEEVAARAIALAVLGSREKAGVERLLLGSHAAQIALEAPCDILLVRRTARAP
jgi:nucleotide-binding universal stress UspA family protein